MRLNSSTRCIRFSSSLSLILIFPSIVSSSRSNCLILTYMRYMMNCWKKIARPNITRIYPSYATDSPGHYAPEHAAIHGYQNSCPLTSYGAPDPSLLRFYNLLAEYYLIIFYLSGREKPHRTVRISRYPQAHLPENGWWGFLCGSSRYPINFGNYP